MPLERLPRPQPFPPISLDGGPPIPIRGWRHADHVFAFATRTVQDTAPEAGKWYAVVMNLNTGRPLHAWPCDTADDAQRIAVEEYAKATGRANVQVFVQDTKDHLN